MMSENVIEQFANDLRDRSDMQTYEEVADELQTATRPEQFMPSVKKGEWPQGAVGIRWDIVRSPEDRSPEICRFEFFKKNGRTLFLKDGRATFPVYIPPGIDPRIKVSREQMEAWEAEQ